MNVYENKEDVYKRVIDDYRKNDTELNGLFFDFPVKMKAKDLLQVYTDIQHDINGDYVVRLKDFRIVTSEDSEDSVIIGTEVDLIPEGEYEYTYEGNMRDFLEYFNGEVEETGLCRIMDLEEDIQDFEIKTLNKTSGFLLDFLF